MILYLHYNSSVIIEERRFYVENKKKYTQNIQR